MNYFSSTFSSIKFKERWQQDILAFVLFLFLGTAVYSNTFDNPFVYDDLANIVNNKALHEPISFSSVSHATLKQYTRFISFFTFSLNYSLHGTDVVGYHVVNFCIHVLSTFLVWKFLSLIFLTPGIKKEGILKYKNRIALFIAVLFLIHPVQTQAVTYISQRMESLATLFYLVSVCFWIKGRLMMGLKKTSAPYFLGFLVAAFLGIFTKEIIITLPFIIFLCEMMFFRELEEGKQKGSDSLRVKFRVILGLSVAFFLLFVYIIQILRFSGLYGAFSSVTTSKAHLGDVLTFSQYVLTQFRVLVVFLKLFIFPYGQNLLYDFPMSKSLWEFSTFSSFVILVGVLLGAFKLRKQHRLISFGLFWFFITLLANFVPRPYFISEHKMYLASIGLCFVAGGCFLQFIKNSEKFLLCLLLMICTYSFLTYQRNKVWENPVALWSDVVKKSPQ